MSELKGIIRGQSLYASKGTVPLGKRAQVRVTVTMKPVWFKVNGLRLG